MRKFLYLMIFALLAGCSVEDWDLSVLPYRSDRDKFEAAIVQQNLKKVQEFIESGKIGVNEIIVDRYHERPLHIATYYAREQIISYLLEKGADINAKKIKASSVTALHVAIWKGYEKTAHQLLDAGVVHSIDLNSGVSTCLFAKRKQMQSVVDRLPSCK